MNTTQTATRIHPLVAIAAGSVILISLVGTAAIAGLLPNSKADTPAPVTTQLSATPMALTAPSAQQYALVPVQVAPVVLQAAPAPAPVVKKVIHHPRPVQRHETQVARYDDRSYKRSYSEPVRAPQAQPVNYLGVGAGALLGGLVGHQVGGGNGKKLATVAGVIGGGLLGNEIANRNGYGR